MYSESDADDRMVKTTRRSVLGALGAGVGLTTLGTSMSAGQSSESWSVIAISDTQFYAEDKTSYPSDQTQWIADNRDAENIAFVSHTGDVVENGDNEGEYQHMDDAMSTLDGTVPYSTVPGNHDWTSNFNRDSSVQLYKEYFGPSRHEGRDYFGGAGPSDGDDNRTNLNSYQLFSAGGYDFLHLGLEWETPGSVDDPSTSLGWAQQVLDQYPDRPTIVSSHSYLRDEPKRRAQVVQEYDDFGNSGQTVWEELITPNSQIFMVLCGHWFVDDGEVHQVSTNDAGETVYEVLANFQSRANGGNGLMRQLQFRPGDGEDAPDRIKVRTFSPSTGEVHDDSDSQFSFDLDFNARFGDGGGSTPDPPEPDAAFQQGSNGYSGTVDTTLQEANPETASGTDEMIVVDSDEPQGSGNATQGLLRFDSIVGSGDGQIPAGASVQSATLTLETADDGDGAAIHRMLTDWAQDDTWAAMDGGVQADGSDAVADAVAETGSVSTGSTTIDVSQSVQAWADGNQNHGWVFRPLGSDGWDFQSAEGGTPPKLTVQYDAPDTQLGDADGDGDVDSDDVTRIQQSIANEDVDIDEEAADVDGDGDIDIGDAIATRNLSEGNQ